MKYMIIPIHFSVYDVLLMSRHECKVESQLLYHSYYQRGSAFRLTKDAQWRKKMNVSQAAKKVNASRARVAKKNEFM